MKVEINVKIIEQQIAKLKAIELSNKDELEMLSIGKCANEQKELMDYYNTLYKNLNLLIQNTTAILENAKDGYIEVEENLIEAMK